MVLQSNLQTNMDHLTEDDSGEHNSVLDQTVKSREGSSIWGLLFAADLDAMKEKIGRDRSLLFKRGTLGETLLHVCFSFIYFFL